MKTSLKLFLPILLLLVSSATAQISIESSDLPLSIGTTFTIVENETAFNLADFCDDLGGPDEWDFSFYEFPEAYNYEVIAPGSAPESDSFPDADLVLHIVEGDTAEFWSFHHLDSDDLTMLGLVIDDPQEGRIIQVYQNPTPDLVFPVTVGSNWVTVHEYSYETEEGTISHYDSTWWDCDSYGTATYGDNTTDCIRCTGEQRNTQVISADGIPIFTSTTNSDRCLFLGKGHTFLFDLSTTSTRGFDFYHMAASGDFTDQSSAVSQIEDGLPLPRSMELGQNYPNPFNPSTTIEFSLPSSGEVSLDIYDVLGRKINSLIDQVLPAGKFRATWEATDQSGAPVASGVYFYRLNTEESTLSRKMLLLK